LLGGSLVDIALNVMNVGAEGVRNGREIDADDNTPGANEFRSDLHPGAWSAAKIKDGVAGADEFAFLLNLFEFVGRPSEIPLVFGFLEVLIVQLARPWGHP
jgi:hypothetical protein